MKLFELCIGDLRRLVSAESAEEARRIGQDPTKHPDIHFMPFEVREFTLPGHQVVVIGENESLQPAGVLTIEHIARLCHEVNRAYCQSIGDDSQPAWEAAPNWQRESAINGVRFHLENDVTPEQSHENWMREKAAAGWTYGPVKDPEKKQHPCMVPYAELPPEQRTKDYLFKAIVDTVKNYAQFEATNNKVLVPDEPNERERLKEILTARGIEYKKNWSTDKLRELVEQTAAAATESDPKTPDNPDALF